MSKIVERLNERKASNVNYHEVYEADEEMANIIGCEVGRKIIIFTKDGEIWEEIL